MNHEQYSNIQWCIGVLEGLGCILEGDASGMYYDVIETLSSIIGELKPHVKEEAE